MKAQSQKLAWPDILTLASLYVLAASLLTSISVMAISHILIAIPGLYYFLKQIKTEWNAKWFRPGLMCLVLVGCGLIATALISVESLPYLKVAKNYKYFFMAALYPFAYYELFRKNISSKHFKIWFLLILIGLLVAHASGIYGMYTGYNPVKGRTVTLYRNAGLFSHILTYGYELVWIINIAIGYFLIRPGFKNRLFGVPNLVLYLIFGLTLIALYLTYTRGAMIAVVATTPFLLFYLQRKWFKVAAILSGLAIVAGIAIVVISQGAIKNRFFIPLNDSSNTIRISQFKSAWYMFQENPLKGVGFKQYERNSTAFKQKYELPHTEFVSHSHNNYLEILAGGGLLVFIPFCLWIMVWFFQVFPMGNQGKILASAILSFLITGLFQSTVTDGENMFFLTNLCAYGMVLCRMKKFSSNQTSENS